MILSLRKRKRKEKTHITARLKHESAYKHREKMRLAHRSLQNSYAKKRKKGKTEQQENKQEQQDATYFFRFLPVQSSHKQVKSPSPTHRAKCFHTPAQEYSLTTICVFF